MTNARKRPWLAAVFAFVYPGLGHVYLREWLRALLWFGFAVTTALVVIPESTFQAVESGGMQAYLDATRGLGLNVVLPILAVQAVNIVDAYWTAKQGNRSLAAATGASADTVTAKCPECGREVDEELDFCQWCTARLDEEPSPNESSTSR
ncbi:hypothetical protein DMJ13_12865 [halophilic archaeon]|nr:hypothetical protein DMJ13_12865 [halophilic archaeon]